MKNLLIIILGFLPHFIFPQTNTSGIINSDTIWSLSDSPYLITGNVLVSSSATLTIEPGVIVKFDEGVYIKVDGNLVAVGESDSKIHFKSSSDNPTMWDGIKIRPGTSSNFDSSLSYVSGSRFEHVIIEHADTALYVYDNGLYLDNSELRSNQTALELRSTNNILIRNTIFRVNNDGIYSVYESYEDDPYGNIENTFIINNTFTENGNGINFNLNQRNFDDLEIYGNIFSQNTSNGLSFSGGGYGCRVTDVDIFNNRFLGNSEAGLSVGQIYGYGFCLLCV